MFQRAFDLSAFRRKTTKTLSETIFVEIWRPTENGVVSKTAFLLTFCQTQHASLHATLSFAGIQGKGYSEDEVELARTGIGGQAGIDGQVVLLLDEEVLRGSERNVGAGKVVGAVARRAPRHDARRKGADNSK